MDMFIKFIRESVSLTDEEVSLIRSKLQIRKYKKGTFLFKKGEVCDKVRFINSGISRTFSIEDGEEITTVFESSTDILIDLYSASNNTPATLNCQALSALECIECLYEDWLKFYEQIPRLERFGRLMTEKFLFQILELREDEKKPLKRRYMELLQHNNELLLQVSQKHIASFLRVQPESLSRIKKEIFNNTVNNKKSTPC